MDKNIEKVTAIRLGFIETMRSLKLAVNEEKSLIIKNNKPFKFLGYRFSNGLIGFDDSSIRKSRNRWASELNKISGKSLEKKIKNLKRLNKEKVGSPDYEFGRIISQKILVNDTKQVKEFSNSLINSLASFLFGYSNFNKRVSATKVLKGMNARTLFRQYQEAQKRRRK
jgi:hypothetical protein